MTLWQPAPLVYLAALAVVNRIEHGIFSYVIERTLRKSHEVHTAKQMYVDYLLRHRILLAEYHRWQNLGPCGANCTNAQHLQEYLGEIMWRVHNSQITVGHSVYPVWVSGAFFSFFEHKLKQRLCSALPLDLPTACLVVSGFGCRGHDLSWRQLWAAVHGSAMMDDLAGIVDDVLESCSFCGNCFRFVTSVSWRNSMHHCFHCWPFTASEERQKQHAAHLTHFSDIRTIKSDKTYRRRSTSFFAIAKTTSFEFV